MAHSKKIHIALNVNDLKRSVEFYRILFGAEPVKCKPGYAKFDVAEPAINLTLNHNSKINDQGVNHLGIQVETTGEVIAAKERLEKAGLVTREEMNVDCCYALQDKVWVADPDGYRWEVFTVKVQDTRPGLTSEQPENSQQAPACCTQ